MAAGHASTYMMRPKMLYGSSQFRESPASPVTQQAASKTRTTYRTHGTGRANFKKRFGAIQRRILKTMSWRIPSGQRKEQYTLPNSSVSSSRTARITAETATPSRVPSTDGMNCH